jgi:hypothetical protein
LDTTNKNYAPLHMNRSLNASKRMEKKMMAKSNWYKKENNDEATNATIAAIRKRHGFKENGGKNYRGMVGRKASPVMFVPWTSKGKLVGRLKGEEERLSGLTDFKVKYQEEGGTPLWLMFSTNLVEGLGCEREDVGHASRMMR